MGQIFSAFNFFGGEYDDEVDEVVDEATQEANTQAGCHPIAGCNPGCTRNTDTCGRKAVNGPTSNNFKGPPNGPPLTGSAPPGHPDACRFEGPIDPSTCSRGCDDPSCVASDIRSNNARASSRHIEGTDINEAFGFKGNI